MAARQTQQDQVDGVCAALGRPPAVDAEDYVDAVYMVLAAAARTHQRSAQRYASWATRKRTRASQRNPCLRRLEVSQGKQLAAQLPTQAGQLEKGLALRSATHACAG